MPLCLRHSLARVISSKLLERAGVAAGIINLAAETWPLFSKRYSFNVSKGILKS